MVYYFLGSIYSIISLRQTLGKTSCLWLAIVCQAISYNCVYYFMGYFLWKCVVFTLGSWISVGPLDVCINL